ncbi:hypothetical protein BJX68DRAFT_244817 [Aspergillus pseudodeflectus]|uniref:Uncharacterized protein n=1 Tax=Aspergillus pseudodeflectus TaxID=176178 RepID=A0ABR4JRL3_9EURO
MSEQCGGGRYTRNLNPRCRPKHRWVLLPRTRPWSIEYILLTIVPRASFIYGILAIELMLRWNRVTGVYNVSSTGELIPFVTGVVGFLDVLFNVRGKYEEVRIRGAERDSRREYRGECGRARSVTSRTDEAGVGRALEITKDLEV